MENFFAEALFWLLSALILALLEIEIEGADGWAAKLPTWRWQPRGIWRWLCLGHDLTGYWLLSNLFIFFILHNGFFLGLDWTWDNELKILSRYCLFLPTWDFLWFVFNPAYGLNNFRRALIPWHAAAPWPFGLMPLDYYSGLSGALFFDWLRQGYLNQNYYLVYFFILILFIFAAPVYHKIYKKLH